MEREQIWRAFRQTGQPLFYLLYKAVENKKAMDVRPGLRPGADS